MNAWVADAGLAVWKPVVTALLLPPVPLLGLVVLGAVLIARRRRLGAWLTAGSVLLLWLSTTTAAAEALERLLLRPPPALSTERIQALQAGATTGSGAAAIVVLGGGMEPQAPEYGGASLRYASLERLRYGIWLGRATGLPLAFSGGLGHAQQGSSSEAAVAARIAASEFGLTLRWVEERSRDTRENAAYTAALLRESGIGHIVLVTHAWHMPRARRAFMQAVGPGVRIEAAPMGWSRRAERWPLRWLPSSAGFRDVRSVLHELLGWAAGA